MTTDNLPLMYDTNSGRIIVRHPPAVRRWAEMILAGCIYEVAPKVYGIIVPNKPVGFHIFMEVGMTEGLHDHPRPLQTTTLLGETKHYMYEIDEGGDQIVAGMMCGNFCDKGGCDETWLVRENITPRLTSVQTIPIGSSKEMTAHEFHQLEITKAPAITFCEWGEMRTEPRGAQIVVPPSYLDGKCCPQPVSEDEMWADVREALKKLS